jgi:leader peptidase (prepilin peptidase) / N-methyltransferase
LPPDKAIPVPLGLLFGLLIGSFLNVCIFRIPRDMSVVAPRSFCPECGSPISWFDNVPLLSFVLLRGRSRCCGKIIGWRYPLVEFMTAVLFALTVFVYGTGAVAIRWCVFEALLIVLFWTDLEERLLPDELTLGGLAAALTWAFFLRVPGTLGALLLPGIRGYWQSFLEAVLGALVLSVPLGVVGLIYARLRGREGIGLGDLKLLLMIGAFLGVEGGLAALLIGAVSGSVIGVAYILWAKKEAATYEIPLGTFLCAGALLVPLLPGFLRIPLDVP